MHSCFLLARNRAIIMSTHSPEQNDSFHAKTIIVRSESCIDDKDQNNTKLLELFNSSELAAFKSSNIITATSKLKF